MEELLRLVQYEVVSIQSSFTNIPLGVTKIKAPEFWKKGYRGNNVIIGVIDTGCQVDHPNLKSRIIGGRNFTSEDRGSPFIYDDYNGHGTHVAGIIAADGNDNGIFGVAPDASLLILKAMNQRGSGTYENVIKAIEYAMDENVNIISLSLGGKTNDPRLHEVIKKAVDNGIIIVCAAANEGDGNPTTTECAFPACYTEVISVGAQDEKGVARFSNTNDQIDLIAPGVNVTSTYIGSQYASISGTSMAAPHVAGALALLINWGTQNFGRNLSEWEVYAQLIKRTISLGLSSMEEGNGMLCLTCPEILQKMLYTGKLKL